ncbi:hypothetical protein NDU88_001646 [Pleurodeles waltl]|uniref:Uncharacterized protein n=1 Tax=Pleurodeles waltl TaxID=8319 RepID=A0AAV7W133_PLEWA|nr:hypothetical protein NDU88_001646 [Pleurodeles waltl]
MGPAAAEFIKKLLSEVGSLMLQSQKAIGSHPGEEEGDIIAELDVPNMDESGRATTVAITPEQLTVHLLIGAGSQEYRSDCLSTVSIAPANPAPPACWDIDEVVEVAKRRPSSRGASFMSARLSFSKE